MISNSEFSTLLRQTIRQHALSEVIERKLRNQGIADDRPLVDAITEYILSGAKGRFEWDGRQHGDITLTMTDEDCHQVAKRVDEFVRDRLPTVVQDFVQDSAKVLATTLAKNWPEQHIHERHDLQAFRERLELRWHKGLDPLRMLLSCSREIGQTFANTLAKSKAKKGLVRREVLLLLHMRACQTTMEVVTLLESGLADGAMARWRTLYEIDVIAALIDINGDELAQRYLDHEAVTLKRALDNELRFNGSELNLPLAKRQQKTIEKDFANVIKKYGKEFGSDYGWAVQQLGRNNPRLKQLEEAAKLPPLPPTYKWASFKVHAGVTGLLHNLGNMSEDIVTLAGASNAGLEEPAILTAHSLTHITSLLFGKSTQIWKTIELAALCNLRDQVLVECTKAARRIERDERRVLDQ